jgi:hypothetical protein
MFLRCDASAKWRIRCDGGEMGLAPDSFLAFLGRLRDGRVRRRKTSYEMSRGIGEKYWKNFEQPNQARSVWQNCPLMQ